MYNNIK